MIGPVRVGPDDRLVHQLLDHDDHPLGGEGRLLLAAEQAPDLGVAGRVGALGVDDRDVGLQRRDGVDVAVAVRRRDRRISGLATGRSVSKYERSGKNGRFMAPAV